MPFTHTLLFLANSLFASKQRSNASPLSNPWTTPLTWTYILTRSSPRCKYNDRNKVKRKFPRPQSNVSTNFLHHSGSSNASAQLLPFPSPTNFHSRIWAIIPQ
ncbi:hypothetical protein L211DRAFT_261316 [Terfezia boudieri ATCC MYA-4762]|uniref:Secreted protein n=1 Tax=Terfezia boudieri ATCC MYA-4762 TaxID=1051890 RepID=A0A3N4MMD7_9PEZI|nr:hypothetical protein L211DRAFT_261316 [Terfezia boudieri ATCC MYA-4762]